VYVDKLAHKKKAKPQLELRTFYGQLQHIFTVQFPNDNSTLKLLGMKQKSDLQSIYVLAGIRTCNTAIRNPPELETLDIHLYSDMTTLDVVDITTIQCLVGRVPDIQEKWAIIDRSGTLARAIADSDDEEPDT
jgi:hypothetical protein